MKRLLLSLAVLAATVLWLAPRPAVAGEGRQVVALDGTWEIGESVAPAEIPVDFSRRVQVPGLVNLARPAFPQVDEFESYELSSNQVRSGRRPASERLTPRGRSDQPRNYFWYRRRFKAPAAREAALLQVNKAQFGLAAWLNGQAVGEYAGCFTAGHFDLTRAIRWGEENTLLIRVGAHPAVLPETYPTGTDFEKLKWTPGIYDRVSVGFCDGPVIESVQIAPQVSGPGVRIQTRVRQVGAAKGVILGQAVRPWKGGGRPVVAPALRVELGDGETRVVDQRVALPGGRLWTPDDPFLYRLETTTEGDSRQTRFGLREFRADAATGLFYLNGRPLRLRGSNITLHRFFEDPECGALPWDEGWLRRLLVEIPRRMHWNSFRLCIGPVPDRWLELADEAGLLIQNEFFVWTGTPNWDKGYVRRYDTAEMVRQYGDWMRDNWNHPSVVIWDANNESEEPLFGREIIPAVRGLDLSNRPWENSYNAPAAPDDPVEYHPYLYQSTASGEGIKFRMSDLETRDPAPQAGYLPREKHPILINEYAWLWLNRDGTPTLLTDKLYPKLLGPNSTTAQRFDLYAYLLAGKTEYWRSSRAYAGLLHFVYLTCSYPGVFTADHWTDVRRLQLEPRFADRLAEAFKPLGVYVNFFQDRVRGGGARAFEVRLINDRDRAVRGRLRLALEQRPGKTLARTEASFSMEALGHQNLTLTLDLPAGAGDCTLRAIAQPTVHWPEKPTVCRRRMTIE